MQQINAKSYFCTMAPHEIYMQRCIDLAQLGAGAVSPNPMVGAVVVHNNVIIGEGYHQKYGQAHAEVNAINQVLGKFSNAAELLKASTIYVSLEPCAHYGKTPPCADLIIKHLIPLVVIGCRDPFTEVNGKGIEKLQQAGIHVISGILEDECRHMNRRFFTRVLQQRPYIILKWAQTRNGFFAPADGSQRWITGKYSRRLVHKWRTEEDAILIGKHTALADNPQLTPRLWPGRPPRRVIIDRNLELNTNLHLFDQSVETFVFNAVKTDVDGNTKYIALEDFDHFVPQYIMYQLYLQDITSVIIEGGAHTLNSFIQAGLWDEARIFTGSARWEHGVAALLIHGTTLSSQQIGDDELEIVTNHVV